MKKLFGVLVLAMAGTACQQQAPPTQHVADAAPVSTVSTDNRVAAAVASAAGAPLAPGQQRLLQQHDLSLLLETTADRGPNGSIHVFNGFFGPSHRRIEVIFTEVQRDANQPTRYYLRGKNRYKGIITPFAGTFTITQLADQPHFTKQELAEGYDREVNQASLYTAVGYCVLREDSTYKNSGVFRGQLALDWWVNPDGELRQSSRTSRTLTQNGGIKFDGQWLPYGQATAKSVVWVEDIFAYGPHILNNFAIGERDPDFNPKYAKLGWNTYWTNDEWWGDSTKTVPTASRPRTTLFSPPVVRADDSATTAD